MVYKQYLLWIAWAMLWLVYIAVLVIAVPIVIFTAGVLALMDIILLLRKRIRSRFIMKTTRYKELTALMVLAQDVDEHDKQVIRTLSSADSLERYDDDVSHFHIVEKWLNRRK